MISVDRKKIICNYENLKKFARGEIFFNEIIGRKGLNFDINVYAVKFEKNYNITFDDLYETVSNFSNSFVDGVEFFYNWAQPLFEVMIKALNLPELLGCTNEDFRMSRDYIEVADDEIILKDIESRIEKQNKEIEESLVNYNPDEMNLFVLDLLVDLFADFVELEDFKVSIKFESNGEVLRIRFNRMYLNTDRKWKVIVSSKCIPFSKVTDTLVLRVANRPYLMYGEGADVYNLVADDFDYNDGVLCFYMNDYLVLEIRPAELLFYVEDQV